MEQDIHVYMYMSKSIQIEMCIRACAKLEGKVCSITIARKHHILS